MQFESKFGPFGESLPAGTSARFSSAVAEIRDRFQQSKSLVSTFERDIDFVMTPSFFMHNSEYFQPFDDALTDSQRLGCDAILVVGIGGSSLGASAVYRALRSDNSVPIYFLETLDVEQYRSLDGLYMHGDAVHVVIISKSGSTLEVGVNSAFAVNMLRRKHPIDWRRYVTVISDFTSPLSEFAQKEGFRWIGIPDVVGGRFSVFSFAGLFPLALAGIDVRALCEGACRELANLSKDAASTASVISAQKIYAAYEHGYWVHDTFVWDSALELLGKWYRQLCAESLGKRLSVTGEVVECGLLPTVSIGTNDLHSMVQLYLGGPRKILTTFLVLGVSGSISVPQSGWEMAQYEGRDIAAIRDAIVRGVEAAYIEDKRPFMTIFMRKTAYDLGQFMMMKMIETVLLGALLQVHPFGQPEVEKYKRAAHKFLAQLV